MSASGWRVYRGATAAVFVALLACGKQDPSTGSGTTTEPRRVRAVQINLRFANRSYVAGEDIVMTVTERVWCANPARQSSAKAA